MTCSITPGPWRVAPAADYDSGVNVDSKSGFVCLVGVVDGDNSGGNERICNDAIAIAEVPEMIDILDALVNCAWQEDLTNIRSRASAVLEKIPQQIKASA